MNFLIFFWNLENYLELLRITSLKVFYKWTKTKELCWFDILKVSLKGIERYSL